MGVGFVCVCVFDWRWGQVFGKGGGGGVGMVAPMRGCPRRLTLIFRFLQFEQPVLGLPW